MYDWHLRRTRSRLFQNHTMWLHSWDWHKTRPLAVVAWDASRVCLRGHTARGRNTFRLSVQWVARRTAGPYSEAARDSPAVSSATRCRCRNASRSCAHIRRRVPTWKLFSAPLFMARYNPLRLRPAARAASTTWYANFCSTNVPS